MQTISPGPARPPGLTSQGLGTCSVDRLIKR